MADGGDWREQDSQELLQFLVNIVTDEQRRCAVQDRGLCFLVNQSFDDDGAQSISDLRRMQALDERNWNPLYGLQVNLLQCTSCGQYRPITNQPFLDVSLSFGQNGATNKPLRLEDCLRLYTEPEVIQGVECGRCSIDEELKLTKREHALAVEQLERMSSKDTVDAFELEIAQHERKDWIHTLEKYLSTGEPVAIDSLERPIQRSLQDCHKRMQFSRSPDIFCFHFNRKVYNAWSGGARKLETYVEFPLELDMSPFCEYEVGADAKRKHMNGFSRGTSGLRERMAMGRRSSSSSSSSPSASSPLLSPSMPFPSAQSRRQNSPQSLKDDKEGHHLMYDLAAVILHHGNERGGHFTAFRRTAPTNQWFFISDDVVREVSADEVLRSCAYMLFYERKHRSKRTSRTSETETDDDDSLPDVPFEHQLVSGASSLY